MTVIRRHMASPAMLVACVSLVVALGGVSYAAGVLPKNSVGTAQLKKTAVSRAKLKKNAVTGAKVKNGSLLAVDFKAGQLPAGPQGGKGDPGPQGPKGDQGAPGVSGREVAVSGIVTVNPGQLGAAIAKCSAGKSVIGGGYSKEAVAGQFDVVTSAPDNHAWVAQAWNISNQPGTIGAYVICANVG
jgi:hypothetical protein